MTQQHRTSRIPEFASREAEAAFWDTHDVTEYWDELTPATVRFATPLSEGLTVRLDHNTLGTLRQHAHRKGVGPTTLVRMWILEHLSGKTASTIK